MGDLAALEVRAPIIITVTMEAEFAPGLFVTASGTITCQDIELEMDNNTASYSIRVGRLVLLPAIVR